MIDPVSEYTEIEVQAQNLSIASFLPYLELPAPPERACVQIRETGGKISLLVTLHSAECGACREYLASLSPISGELDVWDARLLVIVPGPVGSARPLAAPFGKVLSDEHGRLADPASASVIVADRYGQIFDAVRAGAAHELPSARELAEWLKYLGTLCPE